MSAIAMLAASGAAALAGVAATVEVNSGDGQSAAVGAPFATKLSVIVKDSGGDPVANETVTFVLPVSGASGRFAQGTAIALTNASGIATADHIFANATAGAYQVSASVAGVATPALFSLTNTAAATAASLTSSLNPSNLGQSVTFAARFTSAAGAPAPSGIVTVTDTTGSAVLGTPNLSAAVTQTAVVTSDLAACSLDSLGGVWCWGLNDTGQLGDGSTTTRSTPVQVSGLSSGVVALAGGTAHVCALTSAGGVKCWGRNDTGQLGNGSNVTSSSTPVDVTGLSSGVTALSAGSKHTCAVMTGGAVKCWGYNIFGQLGDGTTNNSNTPVDVSSASIFAAVSGGNLHTCGLTTGGGAKCWGYNFNGQLGDGTNAQRSTPVDVSGLTTGVANVEGGGLHSCAVTTTGAAKCWGRNAEGQLGDGTLNASTTPIDVSGLSSGVAKVKAGPNPLHTCALMATGGVKCWGFGGDGRLGDGSTTSRNVPVDVVGISSGATDLAVGGRHSCAVVAGAVRCWGRDFQRQLGDGLSTDRTTPVLTLHPGIATASLTTSAVGGGTRTIEAAFAAATNLGASSATVSQTVNKASTTTTLSSSVSPSVSGQNVTLTATVSSAVGTPGGSVEFFDGATWLGTTTANGLGVATLATSALTVGTHTISAVYGGSGDHLTSTSSTVNQVVNKASTTTALTSSANPSLVNQSVTLTATVTANAPGGGTPAGNVQFFDGATSLGTAALDGTGMATLSTASLSIAAHNLAAVYAGGTSFSGSTSATLQQTVTKRPNTITFPTLADTAFTATPPVPAATADSNLAVSYGSTTTTVCTVTTTGTISFVAAGTCTIDASQAGDATHVAATTVSQSFDVTPGVNTITFPALANTAFTATPPVPAATASSNLTVTYGSATAPVCTVTAGGTISFVSAGTCSIRASQAGNANFAAATDVTQSFDVTPGVNTITFPALANTAFTATPPVPAATASSNLTVTYASATAPVCTATSAGVITFVSAGTCTITASQAGNTNFAAATPVSKSFTVTPGTNVITFPALANTAFSATPPVPAATASSNLTVSYASTTAPVCTATSAGVITFVSAGTCTITASQAGNTNFAAATPVSKSFTVTPGTNVITFPALANTAFSATPPVPAATASSNLTVSYASTTAPVCTATSAGVITFVSVGTCTITASQAGNTNFTAATPVSKSFTVTPGTNVITFPALANTAFTATPPVPAATASSNLTVTYASTTAPVCTATSAGVITFVSAGTCTITASQAGNANFAAATPVSKSFTVTPGTNVITFPALANTAFSATPPVPAATASSNLTVSYASTTAPVCTATSAGVITFVSAGTCTITASQAGNTNFAAATPVSKSFTVTPGTNVITFPALANTAFSATPPVPAATASSNLTVSYASTTAPVCTATSAGVITFVSAGTCTITASQAGNANFAAATPVSKSFTVTPGTNVITFPALANTAFTATPPVPAATASSNLTVTYASTTAPVCTATSAGVITFVSAGTCTITASQAGNANFAAATPVSKSFTVTPGTNVITFPALANTAFTATPPVPAATASSNLTVSYASRTAPVCTATSGGVITFVSAGTCTITASQAGNANFAAATPVSKSFTVTPGTNVITFPALANTAFTATPPVPAAIASSGLVVTYASTTAPVCTATSAGVIAFVSTGTCSITATQAGNANFLPAAPAVRSFTVLKAVTVAVTSPAAAGPYGSPVTFTAKVTVPSGGVPSGTVSFRDGGTLIGVVALSSGSARLTTAALDVGAHSITATYGGSAVHAQAVSDRLIHTVGKATPSVSLAIAPNPVSAGQVVTLRVSVLSRPAGPVEPTGRLVFRDGETLIGSLPLLAGTATLNTSALAAGGHVITASYAGNARYSAAASVGVPLTVQRSCSDLFAKATTLAETTGSASGSSSAATGENGELPHGGDTGAINSVWCKWIAPVTGLVEFDTTGSLFDTTLAAYTGDSVGRLTRVATGNSPDLIARQSRMIFVAEQGKTYRVAIDGQGAARGPYMLNWTQYPAATTIRAAMLTPSRSVPIGSTATAYATILNAGPTQATGCHIALPPGFPATLRFRATTPAGTPTSPDNTAIDIAPGKRQTFRLAIVPTLAMDAAEIPLLFFCANTKPALSVAGINRLALSAAATPTPDVIATTSLLSSDGVVHVPVGNRIRFNVASRNVGAPGTLTVWADDGGRGLPLSITLCPIDPVTLACRKGTVPTQSLRVAYGNGQSETFSIFVKATGAVPFNPALNRVHLRWKTDEGFTPAVTSVAVTSQ